MRTGDTRTNATVRCRKARNGATGGTDLPATACRAAFLGRLCCTMALIIGMMLISPAAATQTIQIILAPNATIEGESILLGEVARILGGDTAQTQMLSTMEVGRAPVPGQSLLLHSGQVEVRLRQNGFDPAHYRISDSGPVRVLRGHESVSGEQIGAAVLRFIEKHAPWQAEQMKIRPIQYNQDHRVPPGKVSLQVIAPKHVDWLGAVPFRVNLLVDGNIVQRTSVSAYIEVWQDVVLAAKPLGRNQPITMADLRMETMNIARVPANAIFCMDQVVGQRANRPIAINSVLRSDQVVLPPVVRRGDVVQLLAESAMLRITTQAIAQENGGVGETIRVINVRSKKNVHAQVVDAQTVRVEF
jgi:flagellar basal body P-ring formation protein FlgA